MNIKKYNSLDDAKDIIYTKIIDKIKDKSVGIIMIDTSNHFIGYRLYYIESINATGYVECIRDMAYAFAQVMADNPEMELNIIAPINANILIKDPICVQ